MLTKRSLSICLAYAVLAGSRVFCPSALASEPGFQGARGTTLLGWQSEEIDRVISFTPYGAPGRLVEVEGRECLSGYQFYLDVLDTLAFDIDESVELVLEFDLQAGNPNVELSYDANSGDSPPLLISLPQNATGESHIARVSLPGARFAGMLEFATDLRIAAQLPPAQGARATLPTLTLCRIGLARSYTTPVESAQGWLNLRTRDEHGELSPTRIGLYGSSGRPMLPAPDALVVKDFSNTSRSVLLPAGTVNWPSEHRQAFYIDGDYRSRLPAGNYTLVATKGIEYRSVVRDISIVPGETLALELQLDRWIDMPARGWSSGDVHTHFSRRDARDNHQLLLQAQAEDLHVTNTLLMGNIARTHFPQRFWGTAGAYSSNGYALVAGQEDPRSAVRGHTVQLNLNAPVRNAGRYLLYHEVSEVVQQQGGVAGYAHLDRLGVRVGMALDALLGSVSFIEVLQRGLLSTDVWFDFLDLGLKISPAAGSDAPYGARIGDTRSYVQHRPGDFPDGWFSGLAAGRTFATNGPIISFSINGAGLGDVLELESGAPLTVSAEATINPDIDRIARMELIELGQVVATENATHGSDILTLALQTTARRSAWYVLKAYGEKQPEGGPGVLAISAPIYVRVAGQATWNRDRVPAIVKGLKAELDAFAALELEGAGRLDEWFETQSHWQAGWSGQQRALRARIQAAKAELDRLARLAEEAMLEP